MSKKIQSSKSYIQKLQSHFHVENFSTNTTVHGFRELYYSKQSNWKVLWTILMLTAVGMTGYQVSRSIIEFARQPTITKIEPLETGQLLYPPLRLCFYHWMSWVDFATVTRLNITKPVLLYGLSYYTMVHSKEASDNEETKIAFQKMMDSNNWITIQSFYDAIAKRYPSGLVIEEPVEEMFREHDIFNGLFCYVTTSPQLLSTISKSNYSKNRRENFNSISISIEKNFQSDTIGYYITQSDIIEFVRAWFDVSLSVDSTKRNFETYLFAKVLFINGMDEKLYISPEMDEYNIRLTANVHKWHNTVRHPCKVNEKSFSSDSFYACEVNILTNLCGCSYLISIGFSMKNVSFHSVCRYKFNYRTNKTLGFRYCDDVAGFKDNGGISEKEFEEKIHDCKQSTCNIGCERWDYETSVTLNNNPKWLDEIDNGNYTVVNIKYPVERSVIVVSEINSQSFEIFVSNVGGLLGIWLGASIVSFIQTIYLCFASEESTEEETIKQ